MGTRYWVGGTGTWNNSNTTNWSQSSGGAGGAGVPTSTDDVYFDGNSGSGTVSLGVAATVGSLTFKSTMTGALSYSGGTRLLTVMGGDLTFEAGASFTLTGNITVDSNGGSSVIDAHGFGSIGGTLTAAGTGGNIAIVSNLTANNLTKTGTSTLTLNAGVNLTIGAGNWNAGNFVINGYITLTSGGNITNVSGSNHATISGSGTIRLIAATIEFDGNSCPSSQLILQTSGACNIQVHNSGPVISDLVLEDGSEMSISVDTDGVVYITGGISHIGGNSLTTTLNSMTPGSQMSIYGQPSAVYDVYNLKLQDAWPFWSSTPVATWRAHNCTNVSNNNNWTFLTGGVAHGLFF